MKKLFAAAACLVFVFFAAVCSAQTNENSGDQQKHKGHKKEDLKMAAGVIDSIKLLEAGTGEKRPQAGQEVKAEPVKDALVAEIALKTKDEKTINFIIKTDTKLFGKDRADAVIADFKQGAEATIRYKETDGKIEAVSMRIGLGQPRDGKKKQNGETAK